MWPVINEESDESNYDNTNDPMDLYIISSIDDYAAVQRSTAAAVRQLTCDCTEITSITSANVASTSMMAQSQMLYFDESSVLANETAGSTSAQEVDIHHRLPNISEEYTNCAPVSPQPTRSKVANTRHRVYLKEPCSRRRRRLQKMSNPSVAGTQLANRLIKYARCKRNEIEIFMCCVSCGHFPTSPVTGVCGHTRCAKCIERDNLCPCGSDSPEALHVNIVVQNLIENSDASASRLAATSSTNNPVNSGWLSNNIVSDGPSTNSIVLQRRWRRASMPWSSQEAPMSPLARYNHSMDLMRSGKHFEAAAHMAIAAASEEPAVRIARKQLAQIITNLTRDGKCIKLCKELMRLIRNICSNTWISPRKLECILCCETFNRPVTTPCGHTFCRTCIEKTLDYRKKCPLCVEDLDNFNVADTNDTVLVQAALVAICAIQEPGPPEPDLIPIFMCTVAYPSVPCPLFLFDPRYWMMLRRVLQSGSRKFGMVAYDKHRKYADYGTILEVRDCVLLEDGRSLLSTIGISRFKMIERDVRDGCDVARVVPLMDNVPEDVFELKMLETHVMFKAKLWLSRLNIQALATIESTFGRFPTDTDEWWNSPDGPAWLWWFIAVLPLRSEIKVLMLSTTCLIKRMMAVVRTLEAIDGITLANFMM